MKIQYPGIERAIKADLRAVRMLRPFARAIVPAWDLDGIVGELANQVVAECDYEAEAIQQERFRALFTDEQGLHVPAAIRSHSRRHVLTSELLAGVGFYEFCATATPGDRNRAGELITRFVIRTLVGERWFNTDFHPGNFLFSGGDVWCIDLFAFRAYFGSFALLAELGAELNWRRPVLGVLAEHDLRSGPRFVTM